MTQFFSWDEAKAEINQRKHGVTFEFARRVFLDPFAFGEIDWVNDWEQRWRTFGLVNNVVVLIVVHTTQDDDDDEIIRIISAREATRRERDCYFQNRYDGIRSR